MKKATKKLISVMLIMALVLGITPLMTITVSASDTSYIKISAGTLHTLAIQNDGSAWAWGNDQWLQLGVGGQPELGNVYTGTPHKIIDSDVVDISAGDRHSMAIKSDGSLWAWGDNYWGQLYYDVWSYYYAGVFINSEKPVKVMDNIKSVSAGNASTAVIKTDGTLWVWGTWYSLSGVGETYLQIEPEHIADDVIQIVAGRNRVLFIKSDNSLWEWDPGKLSIESPGPVKIMDDVSYVSSGIADDSSTMVIKTDGSLWGWGANDIGQLGNGTRIDSPTPIKIMDDVAAVSHSPGRVYLWSPEPYSQPIGGGFTLALKKDGTFWSWGSESGGKLGGRVLAMQNVGFVTEPIRVGQFLNAQLSVNMDDTIAISAGGSHSVAIKSDGTLWTWGDNYWGQLGRGFIGSFHDLDDLYTDNRRPARIIEPPPGDGSDPEPPPPTGDPQLIAFVVSLYQNIQGREPDSGGLEFWVSGLQDGTHTGASVSGFFFFSEEYTARNRSDIEFVNDLYNTCMGRPADPGGLEYWLDQIALGASRVLVLNAFLNGDEFKARCVLFGVEPGRFTNIDPNEFADMSLNITTFIFRCYDVFLGRVADREGLNNWTGHLINKVLTPTEVAREFVFSEEFIGFEYDDEEFLDAMYQGMMGREPDEGGYNHWMSILEANPGPAGRQAVFNGFAQSDEWKGIVADFGL